MPRQRSKSIADMSCEILQKTNDGDDLSPEHLYLLQEAVNGHLNEAGEVEFYKLHKNAMDGYRKPWFHGIENMTQDHDGFVYWRWVQVEHYSFTDYKREREAAKGLAERCRHLEEKGIKPTSTNAIWEWEENR